MKHIRSKLHRCAFAVSTILCSSTLLAQQTAPTEEKAVERMQVTGSHIKRTDLEGPSPVTIIDRNMIDKSGFDNLQQLLERLPVTGPAIIAANHALGTTMQINGTPSFVIDQTMVRGYVPLDAMRQIVEGQRRDG